LLEIHLIDETMKITLLTVGKTTFTFAAQGEQMYQQRIGFYVPFKRVDIPQLKSVASLSKDAIKVKEGELILKNLRPDDYVILLDERGRHFTSLEWAAELEKRMTCGGRDIVFVVGGAYGFSEDVYKRANESLSLSKMTFSHQIVRFIFLEQLYRAFTIIKGEPYHHE